MNCSFQQDPARDMFLYIKDDLLDEAQSFLAKRLEGKADVVKTESLIEDGYFGAGGFVPFSRACWESGHPPLSL